MQPETKLKKNLPKKQVVLPFLKSVEIAVKSIKSRFFRSLITTISLILAISFYSYIKTNSYIISGIVFSENKIAIQTLSQGGYEIPATGEQYNTTPKERWILFLSLLVCVVGIVNTQLMAVADRFREIGTMKCLGALDRFILKLFLIEAFLQGFIGAAIGALTGAGIALCGSLIKFGTLAITYVSFNGIFISIASSILLGCFLSLLGVLYPALLAARMQPIEAMRGRD
ncbi:FtsX-like permease family protein [Desulfobacula sp.]|uniref:ABC transporter permease n=1 Tax=Desulfobacula sp. TaxID=2593537 RepID=UPI0025BF7153|nr:FtsX-like permease family protein [Desulfobacula sp.]MBC2703836.1 FtsX-like permease family protein [Desulfobacula sp.]